MPLLNVTGITNIGTTFNIGFGFVTAEDEEAYELVIRGLEHARDSEGIAKPSVLLTDFETGLKKALRTIYPDINQQICLWHVQKNIAHEVKKKWIDEVPKEPREKAVRKARGGPVNLIDPLLREYLRVTRQEEPAPMPTPTEAANIERTPRGFISIWQAVVYAKTVPDFNKAWQYLVDTFPHQQPSIYYLYHTYLPYRKHFVEAYVCHNRNFGVRATSRTEGSHKEVKSYLFNTSADLAFVFARINTLLRDQEEEYRQGEAVEVMKQLQEHKGLPWLGDILTQVSRKAQKLIIEQHRIYRARIAEIVAGNGRPASHPTFKCTRSFRRQFGLPCSHHIEGRLSHNTPISVRSVNRHWLLVFATPKEDFPLLVTRDPDVVPRRGRPATGPERIPTAIIPPGGGNFRRQTAARAREPSHWECGKGKGRQGGQGVSAQRQQAIDWAEEERQEDEAEEEAAQARREHAAYMEANAARFAELDALARSDSEGAGAGGVDEGEGSEGEILDVIEVMGGGGSEVIDGLDIGIEGPLDEDGEGGIDGVSGFGRTDIMLAQLERELGSDSGGE